MKSVFMICFQTLNRYVWRSDQHSYSRQEEDIIQLLPDSLRGELLIESNKIILKECPLFDSNFSEDLIKSLIPIIQEKTYTPDETIFTQSEENGEKSIYFIQSGEVDIQMENRTKIDCAHTQERYSITLNSKKEKPLPIKRIQKGDYFGEIEFFTGNQRQTSAKSVGFTTILKIDRNMFIYILEQNPLDYEQFCLIKDRILFNSDYSKIFSKCQSCNSISHTISSCPFIHFNANKHKILTLSNQSKHQTRMISSRIKYHYSSLDKYSINEFLEINQFQLEEYCQKYLNFTMSRCDVCAIRQDKKLQRQTKLSTYSNTYLETKENHFSSHLNHQIQSNQNSNYVEFYASSQQKLQIEEYQQNPKTYSPRYIPEDLNQNKLKSCMKNSIIISSSKSIPDQTEVFLSPKLMRLSTAPRKKSIKYACDFENQNNNITSPVFNQLDSPIQCDQNTFFDTVEEKRDVQQKIHNQKPIQQSNNNCYSSVNNFVHENNIKMNSKNIIPEEKIKRTHQLQIFFDLFNGTFEQMNSFKKYYPLSNYEYILKQLSISQDLRKKKKKNIFSNQGPHRRSTTLLTLKERKSSLQLFHKFNKSQVLENDSLSLNFQPINLINSSSIYNNNNDNFNTNSQISSLPQLQNQRQKRNFSNFRLSSENEMHSNAIDKRRLDSIIIRQEKKEEVEEIDIQNDSFFDKFIRSFPIQNEQQLKQHLNESFQTSQIEDSRNRNCFLGNSLSLPQYTVNKTDSHEQDQIEDIKESFSTIKKKPIHLIQDFQKSSLNLSLYASE